jgi:hypothetical protein
MPKSLLVTANSVPERGTPIGTTFGIKPHRGESWDVYYSLKKLVGLKKDLKWPEVQLQNMLIKADIWDNFPAVGLSLVRAEFKGSDENQRIDILYLRDDGGLLPCELKIGGEAKDSHGQLIRYMADLSFQTLNLAYLNEQAEIFRGGNCRCCTYNYWFIYS